MRRLLLLGGALLLMLMSSCGDGDETPRGATYDPQTSRSAVYEPDTSDGACPDTHPHEPSVPDDYAGLVTMCSSYLETSKLIENISNVVLIARPGSGQAWTTANVTSPPESFAAAAVQHFAPGGCGTQACTVPPGSTLSARADGPVEVLLSVAAQDTLSTVFVTALAQALERRFTPAQLGSARRFATCAQATGAVLESDRWEEAFRYGMASGCKSVLDDLIPPGTVKRQSLVRRVTANAKALSNGLWVDALIVGSKLVR